MLIRGPGSRKLCDRIAKKNDDIEVVDVESKIFPDGEIYVRLEDDVEGEDCYLVQTTYPNRNLIELYFTQDALVENGADSITVVAPYYSYARQDQIFEPGEGLSARSIAKRIQLEAKAFYSVDLHSEKILDFFDIFSYNFSAMPLLADHSEVYDPDLFISPDEGGLERVKTAAEEVDIEWDYLEKNRIDGETVEIRTKNIGVEGKTVVILDDIISTGGTMREASKQLLDQGAEEVHAGCTHGLFVGDAMEKLDEVCDSIFCTDTIECEKTEVTVTPFIEEIID